MTSDLHRKAATQPEMLSDHDIDVIEKSAGPDWAELQRLRRDHALRERSTVPAPAPPAAHRRVVASGMTRGLMRDLMAGIAVAIKGLKVPALWERVQQLEAKIAALEERGVPSVRWCGIWSAAQPYRVGELTTKHGGLWLCTADVPAGVAPGHDTSAWRLVAKGHQR